MLIKRGCGADILINICLWVLGWIPGVCVARSLSLLSCADSPPSASTPGGSSRRLRTGRPGPSSSTELHARSALPHTRCSISFACSTHCVIWSRLGAACSVTWRALDEQTHCRPHALFTHSSHCKSIDESKSRLCGGFTHLISLHGLPSQRRLHSFCGKVSASSRRHTSGEASGSACASRLPLLHA